MGEPQLGAPHHKDVATTFQHGKERARDVGPGLVPPQPPQPSGTIKLASRITAQGRAVPVHNQTGHLGQSPLALAPLGPTLSIVLMLPLAAPAGEILGKHRSVLRRNRHGAPLGPWSEE